MVSTPSLRTPNVFLIMFGLMVFVGALSWFVPGSEHEHDHAAIKPSTYPHGDNSQHYRQSIVDVLAAPTRGFTRHASTIAFVLVAGAAVKVVELTGCLAAIFAWLAVNATRNSRYWAVALLMVAFSFGGATIGMSEELIPLSLITVPLAMRLGFDALTGAAIPLVGAQVGFAAAFINPFNVGIAKKLGGLPIADGLLYRIACWGLFTAVATVYVLVHARRVAHKLAHSNVVPEPDNDVAITWRHVVILALFVTSLAASIFLMWRGGWDITQLSALLLGVGIVSSLIGGLSPRRTAETLVAGARDLVSTALLIAFAGGILTLAENGGIVDALLHGCQIQVAGTARWIVELGMFGLEAAIKPFVPSASGQATLTIPLLMDIAKSLGNPPENVVLAYQFGDGLTLLLIPTSAVVMGVLETARIEYLVWLRWMAVLYALLAVVACVCIVLSPL